MTARYLYSRFGVQEMWLVDIEQKAVEIVRSHGGCLAAVETVSGECDLTSPLLPGFEVVEEKLFGA